jgi:hypothetical protein
MEIPLCLAWQERQISGWAVNVCPTKITNTTPIKVRMGPTPKITHFDFRRVLILLMLIIEIDHFIRPKAFIGSFL